MRQTLRGYQREIIDELRQAYRSHHRVICQLPTGAGKTTVAAAVAELVLKQGGRVWMVAHRRQLVSQAFKRMVGQGLPTAIYQAGDIENPHADVQVVGIDTLAARLRAGYKPPPPPDLMIVDEAHHCVSKKWEALFAYAPQSRVLGLSATPYRLDGSGLGQVFEEVVVGPTPRELVDEGHLTDVRMWAPPGADLSKVKKTAGDYQKNQLAEAMGSLVGDVAEHYLRLAPGKQAILFAVNRAHSEALVANLLEHDITAAHLDFRSNEAQRQQALDDFAAGRTKVLCNVELFTEGFDMPATEVCIMARPTLSEALFVQMVGRALRPADGKEHAIVIDHAGNLQRHGHPLEHRPAALDGRKARERKDADEDGPLGWVCEECFAFNQPKTSECAFCDAEKPKRVQKVETEHGTLEEWAPNEEQEERRKAMSPMQKRAWWTSLEDERREKGYKPWWSSFQYRNYFGRMPHEDDLFTRAQKRAYWNDRRRGG